MLHQTGNQHTNARQLINSATIAGRRHSEGACRQREIYKRKVRNVTEGTTAFGGDNQR